MYRPYDNRSVKRSFAKMAGIAILTNLLIFAVAVGIVAAAVKWVIS